MASSLIDELQLSASTDTIPVSSLLRKALLVAGKLDVADIPEWINHELSGYPEGVEVPPYRKLNAAIKARHYGSWLPVQFPTTELRDIASQHRAFESVGFIEGLLRRDGQISVRYNNDFEKSMQELFQHEGEFVGILERSSFDAILDEVRNRVLQWAIALDRAGVRGERTAFTQPEKEKAHNMVFNIHNSGGTNSHVHVAEGNNARIYVNSTDNSTNSITYNAAEMASLAEEFSRLRAALLPVANDPEHYASIGALAKAEMAAKEGQSHKLSLALSGLGKGGGWALTAARDIGVHLAAAAIAPYLGLGPS